MKILKNNFIKAVYSIILCLTFFSVTADERKDPIDVFLVVDKSLSMEEKITSVKEYINDNIIDGIPLKPGDFFSIIAFYGKSDVVFTKKIETDEDLSILKEKINRIDADGRFTDIGKALERLENVYNEYGEKNRYQFLVLMTDGIQEAPKDSIYYSEDNSFNHTFLENTEPVWKKGWKIHMVSIGSDNLAKRLSEIADSETDTIVEYHEIAENITGENITEEDIEEELGDMIGNIFADNAELRNIKKSREADLIITLSSKIYKEGKNISIDDIKLIDNNEKYSILPEEYKLRVEPDSTREYMLHVKLPKDIGYGEFNTHLELLTSGDAFISPVSVNISFDIERPFNFLYVIIPLAVLLLIAAIILLVHNSEFSGQISFRMIDDEGLYKSRRMILKYGRKMYINGYHDSFSLMNKLSKISVARLVSSKKGLTLSVIDSSRFIVDGEIPENILNKNCRVKTSNGDFRTLLFMEV